MNEHEVAGVTEADGGLRVMAAVAGTHADEGIVVEAAREAARRGTSLLLVHVAPGTFPFAPSLPVDRHRVDALGFRVLRKAEDSAHDVAPDVSVSRLLAVGSRVEELVESATGAGLVVVGRETRHGLDRALVGAVTNGVVGHAPCPVRVVPGAPHLVPGDAPVVVGLAGDPGSQPLLAHAFAEAASRGAPVVVLHAWHLPGLYADWVESRTHADDWRETGTAFVESELADVRAEHPDVPVEVRIVHDDPALALTTAAQGAALVVVARPQRTALVRGHLGRVIRTVVAHSDAPVDVVPVRVTHRATAAERPFVAPAMA